MSDARLIVFYDGDCGFCDTSIRQLMRIDARRQIRYAPLQGQTAAQNLPPDLRDTRDLKTLVFLDSEGRIHTKSTAVIAALAQIGGIWKGCQLALILPASFRDWFYDRVAIRRRSLIAKASCPLPTPDERARMLP